MTSPGSNSKSNAPKENDSTRLVKPSLTNPVHMLAFGLGSGLSPKAPGTVGTIAALPIYWWLLADLSTFWLSTVIVVMFVIGVLAAEKTSQDLGVHDHGGIVIDEWVGMWITMLMVPKDFVWLLIGFALFRFFDILKPWPIKWLDEHVHGGFGIMIDDVLAGLMAMLCLHLIIGFMT
jgi:phosphatidylglycerophosphatase A